jgi:outer membrane protein TolC
VAEVERLRLARQEALQELSALLHLPEGDSLQVAATAPFSGLTSGEDTTLIQEAFAARADLWAMRARYAQADARVAEAYGGRIPWPGYLQVSYEMAGRQDPGGWEVGLGVELPFLNWGTAKIRRLEAERAMRRAEFEGRTREVASEVRRVLGSLRASGRSVALYRDQILPAVERNLNQTRRAVAAGQADQRRLLAAQERALKEKREYLEILLRRRQSLIELDRITGRGDREGLEGHGD